MESTLHLFSINICVVVSSGKMNKSIIIYKKKKYVQKSIRLKSPDILLICFISPDSKPERLNYLTQFQLLLIILFIIHFKL